MLEDLISLTSDPSFFGNYHLACEQALYTKTTSLDFIISITKDESEPSPDNSKWYLISCRGVVSDHGVGQLRVPNYKIELLEDHPLLWHYKECVVLSIEGTVPSMETLLGRLYLANVNTTGNWIGFSGLVGGLINQLSKTGKASMVLPKKIMDAYTAILLAEGLRITAEPFYNRENNLKLLHIGHPLNSPKEHLASQVYIVAEEFSAESIAPNTTFPQLLPYRG